MIIRKNIRSGKRNIAGSRVLIIEISYIEDFCESLTLMVHVETNF